MAASDIEYVDYTDESMMAEIQALVAHDLSEPYSVFTYRYFLHNWPSLCVCVFAKNEDGSRGSMIGTIIAKAEDERGVFSAYIAMLTVNSLYRKKRIGHKLFNMILHRVVDMGCEEIVLETEASNTVALAFYDKLGFSRDEKMGKYYLNGGDAYRLRLVIDRPQIPEELEESVDRPEVDTAGSA